MRVLVTGSRDWTDWATVWLALDEVDRESSEPLTVVHGACPTGADEFADQWGTQAGCTVERHPATWRLPNGQIDKGAGFARNAHMVGLGADVCLAFIGPCTKERCTAPRPHGSHGASHCSALADSAGIPVRPVLASALA